tara:strand:+ start:134 stop:1174 length:1041 start_codon:yes stop_codon:yes gene_type:complete
MKILVTGGAGYIGSHTCIELLEYGHQLVVLDNLSNSKLDCLISVSKLTNIYLDINNFTESNFAFFEGDISDNNILTKIFSTFKIQGVIHFAGLKDIGESIKNPKKYYKNNVAGTIVLIEIMKKYNCKNFVFSSSAAIYGEPHTLPIKENFPYKPFNPYAQSKLEVENLLRDLYKSDNNWHIVLLRYFNPIGAHESGLIGENPKGIPNNLVPYISQVAMGKLKKLNIFGNDYNTPDGTAVRDYIHVVDLAKSHIKALLAFSGRGQILAFNIGTGVGYSVLEIVKTFEKVSNKKIPYRIKARRPGDVVENYADSTLASDKLGWKAEKNLEKMCFDTWNFQKRQEKNSE